MLWLGPKWNARIDEVAFELRNFAGISNGMDLHPVSLKLLFAHPGFGVRKDKLMNHGYLLQGGRACLSSTSDKASASPGDVVGHLRGFGAVSCWHQEEGCG